VGRAFLLGRARRSRNAPATVASSWAEHFCSAGRAGAEMLLPRSRVRGPSIPARPGAQEQKCSCHEQKQMISNITVPELD
jgi:hypothetical protein